MRYGIQFELHAAVIANHPVPPEKDYYFEIKILAEGNDRYDITASASASRQMSNSSPRAAPSV
jgi:hypothetical protein